MHLLLVGVLATATVAGGVVAEENKEEHCVVFVVDQTEKGELITTDPECFSTEDQANSWGQIAMSGPYASMGMSSTGLSFVPLASTFTLGRHYDGFNGSGSSISVVGSSCTGGWWNTSSSWDNKISSSYNGCARLKHYDLPNKLGTAQNTYGAGTTDNLSLMNNRTESVSYHSS